MRWRCWASGSVFDGSLDIVEANRLGDEVLKAGVLATIAVFFADGGGHGDDMGLWGNRENGFCGLEPVHLRHLQVEKDGEGGRVVFHEANGFRSALGENGLQAEAFNKERTDFQIRSIVIDENDGGLGSS